jgi:hypothetical protein
MIPNMYGEIRFRYLTAGAENRKTISIIDYINNLIHAHTIVIAVWENMEKEIEPETYETKHHYFMEE